MPSFNLRCTGSLGTRLESVHVAISRKLNCVCRNPQLKRRKYAVSDKHLIVFVVILLIVDLLFLILYTMLEGLVARFGAGVVPSKEKPVSIDGVSLVS